MRLCDMRKDVAPVTMQVDGNQVYVYTDRNGGLWFSRDGAVSPHPSDELVRVATTQASDGVLYGAK